MALNITIWEPGRHWRNAVLVPLFVVLSPLLLAIVLFARLFDRPASTSPREFEGMLTVLIEGGPDFDNVLDVIHSIELADRALEAFRKEVVAIPAPPWDNAVVQQLMAIRDGVSALVLNGERV